MMKPRSLVLLTGIALCLMVVVRGVAAGSQKPKVFKAGENGVSAPKGCI